MMLKYHLHTWMFLMYLYPNTGPRQWLNDPLPRPHAVIYPYILYNKDIGLPSVCPGCGIYYILFLFLFLRYN